jgi:cadmium resistance protein CadD (predicted permease)
LPAPGLTADVGVAAAAFVGTNVDNCIVTMAMVAGAPVHRARRIAAGQVAGFVAVVLVSAAAAALLIEFSTAAVGLLGLIPLAIGLHGLLQLWRKRPGKVADRAVGRGFAAAALVTIAASGDNLAVYIPLFRVGGASRVATIAVVFAVGEVVLTWLVLTGGRHPKARQAMARFGAVAVPILLCGLGVLVMAQAGTLNWL